MSHFNEKPMVKSTKGVMLNTRSKAPQADLIFTDPLVVISFLEKAIENLKSKPARLEAAIDCISIRKEILWNEFGLREAQYKTLSQESIVLKETNPLVILDHLERSIGYLNMPGAKMQAWLSCMSMRSMIMNLEYGQGDNKRWAYHPLVSSKKSPH